MTPYDKAALDRVLQPVDKANGLPNEFYIDPETCAAERRDLFFPNWAGVGLAADIPATGDAKPIDFLGMPLLALRDDGGNVRVFQNTCRHRGTILVDRPTKLRSTIRCPYHSWCYGLDGSLRSTPHVGGPGRHTHADIDRDALGLIEIRSHLWRDVIFVNVGGTAPAFEVYAGTLIDRWRELDRPLLHGGPESFLQFDIACNWKLAVENFCESYHLPWIHPGLNKYSRLEDHYDIVQPGYFSGQGTTVYAPKLDDSGRRFTDFAGLSDRWDAAAEYIALYPNVLFGVHKDHTYGIVIEPVSHEKSIEHVEIFYTKAEVTGDDWREMREQNAAMWKEIFVEDIFVVEGMQKGRHASGFDGGKFSPVMDSPTHCFHHWVATQMQD